MWNTGTQTVLLCLSQNFSLINRTIKILTCLRFSFAMLLTRFLEEETHLSEEKKKIIITKDLPKIQR